MRLNVLRKLSIVFYVLHLVATIPACSIITGGIPQQADDVFIPEGDGVRVEAWIENLNVPWSLIFLDGDKALVSERRGTIRLIKEGRLIAEPYEVIDAVHKGEGGLMGLALHPDYPRKPYVYAMHTYEDRGGTYNRVIRLRGRGESGEFDTTIIKGLPGGRFHNGGRIGFGPDGMLYITTGEVFESSLAQDLKSTGGKILRITADGGIPSDNPFTSSPVYSYGHRNSQGIAWHPETQALYASEHGPSGEFGKFAHDEINIIIKGGNYGWPEIIGAAGDSRFKDPLIVWKNTTPPSGITFYRGGLLNHLKGNLFVATLRSQSLIRIVLNRSADKAVRIERWFADDHKKGRYGRIRDVVEGPDGALYFLTNNTDGRGDPKKGDDRIYRIIPE